MAFILHQERMIVEGKPLRAVLQGTSGNGAQALVFLPNNITSVVVAFYQDKRTNEEGYYCWHEDKEELEVDDFHLTYQSDYERGLVAALMKSFSLDVNALIWYPWPGDIPHAQVCWHCGALYEIGSAKDDLFCSDACYDAH
jgi:hypothetical protein